MLRLIFGKISLHTALQSDPIYVFPEMKLRDLVPNFQFMCLYIVYSQNQSTYFPQQNRQTDGGSQIHECRIWD